MTTQEKYEQIIKKSIDGGYSWNEYLNTGGLIYDLERYVNIGQKDHLNRKIILDPIFWQALGKACGWENAIDKFDDKKLVGRTHIEKALDFHEINLTQSFDSAVDWLSNEISK